MWFEKMIELAKNHEDVEKEIRILLLNYMSAYHFVHGKLPFIKNFTNNAQFQELDNFRIEPDLFDANCLLVHFNCPDSEWGNQSVEVSKLQMEYSDLVNLLQTEKDNEEKEKELSKQKKIREDKEREYKLYLTLKEKFENEN